VEEVSTIGMDIAKTAFQAHGADAAGHQLFSRRISRAEEAVALALGRRLSLVDRPSTIWWICMRRTACTVCC
jgi:hypothetical protein